MAWVKSVPHQDVGIKVGGQAGEKSDRNETMELCKMLAAIMVVFVHAEFPDHRGQLISCLGRFSVPIFFAFSGYFNVQATSEQAGRRLRRTAKLTILATVLSAIIQCLLAELNGWSAVIYLRSLFAEDWAEVILQALVIHTNPFSIHLWYLSGLTACYLVLWIYIRGFGGNKVDFRYLYILGAVLMAIYCTLSFLMPMADQYHPCELYRNGWLLGLPMFLLGMFLHEYEDQFVKNFSLTTVRQQMLIFGGLMLTLLQWEANRITEIPMGTLLLVPGLVLYASSHSELPVKGQWIHRLAGAFGTVSTALYIIHPMVIDVYDDFLHEPLAASVPKEHWLRPVVILMMSLAVSILWERITTLIKRTREG